MNKTLTFILVVTLIGVATFTGFVVAGYVATYLHPTKAQGQIINLAMYLDDTAWTNNTDLDWGPVTSDEIITADLDIQSVGDLNCTVTMIVTGLPAGWTQTYSQNGQFLESGEWLNGTITLTTTTVYPQAYVWDTTFTAIQYVSP